MANVGDKVTWDSSGGAAYGVVQEKSESETLTAQPSGTQMEGEGGNPALLIEIYAQDDSGEWQGTEETVVHREGTLTVLDEFPATRSIIQQPPQGGNVRLLRVNEGKPVVGGLLVRFMYGAARDAYDTYFDERTNYRLDEFPITGLPVLYQHGMSPLGMRRIGTITRAEMVTGKDNPLDNGLFIEAELDGLREYVAMLAELEEKAMRQYGRGFGWSGGAFPQAVRVAADGHVQEWVYSEASLTLTPADPFNEAESYKRIFAGKGDNGHKGEHDEKRAPIRQSQTQERAAVDEVKKLIDEFAMQMMDMLAAMLDSGEERMAEEDEDERGYKEKEDEARMSDDEKDEARALFAKAARAAVMADTGVKRALDEDDPAQLRASVRDVLDARMRSITREVVGHIAQQRNARRTAAQAALREAMQHAAETTPGTPTTGAGVSRSIPAEPTAPARKVQVGDDRRFARFTADDMAFGYLALRAGIPKHMQRMISPTQIVSEEYYRAMAHKTQREVDTGRFADPADAANVRAAIPWRADEIDATNITGQGEEWVGVLYGTVLWERARNEVALMSMLRQKGLMEQEIPQGSGSVIVPTEGSDPVAYSTPEANDLDSTNRVEVTANVGFFGTGNVTHASGQVKIASAVTDEFTEDSVIDVLQNQNRQTQIKALETLEQALINGDQTTTANDNINLNDGTPGTGIARPYYLAQDGLRHYPLIGNTDYARDAGGNLTLDDFRLTLALFESQVRARRNNLFYLVDVDTHTTALAIPEIATDDVRRTNATITSGVIENIYGVDMMQSGFLELAESDGTRSGTDSNNTLGQILMVYAPYWLFGWKREVTFESQRDILSGVTYAVASMRFAFTPRGNNAAALTYNVGIS